MHVQNKKLTYKNIGEKLGRYHSILFSFIDSDKEIPILNRNFMQIFTYLL